MIHLVLAAMLAQASPSPSETPFPTSGPAYCSALNTFATDLVGADPAEPVVYTSALFEGAIAIATGMDPTVKPTHDQIVKAAQDSEDCFPNGHKPA